ncbi:MAG: flagellar hook-length control protein [Burkholderiaceae bacterium]
MSIAVTAVVRPSRLLLAMVSTACLCVILVAGLVGCNYFGILPLWERLFLATTYIVVAISCWSLFFFAQRFYLISISSAGQIRLLHLGRSADIVPQAFDANNSDWFVVNLLDDSTLWSKLLLLLLRSDSGRLIILPILPDSVSIQSFRSLSVACGWIAARISQADK